MRVQQRAIQVDPAYLRDILTDLDQCRRDRNEWRALSFILFGAWIVLMGAIFL